MNNIISKLIIYELKSIDIFNNNLVMFYYYINKLLFLKCVFLN